VLLFSRRACLGACLALALLALAPLSVRLAAADDIRIGTLAIQHPWSRATAGAAKSGALYLTVRNNGTEADRLTGVSTAVSAKAELHLSEMSGDVMTMRATDVVEVPAGGSAVFEPQGAHIMLVGLKQALKKGDRFKATLHFAAAGDVEVEVTVQGIADMAPAQ